MPVDFTKFPFPGVEDPHASTLLEAIRTGPVDAGFVVVMLKVSDPGFPERVRAFARDIRANAATTGLADITAYRRAQLDELGGAVAFDQAIIDQSFRDAEKLRAAQPDEHMTVGLALKMAQGNDAADWLLLVEFKNTDQAMAAAAAWRRGDESFSALTQTADSSKVVSFKNTMRYANVSRDPNVIQFFNLFPGPGDPELLWPSWQEALPWFFEVGEVRSSFPLVALDEDPAMLLINCAHFDSVKHFFLGVFYDPIYLETVTRCYADRGFTLPLPYFCKIVPV